MDVADDGDLDQRNDGPRVVPQAVINDLPVAFVEENVLGDEEDELEEEEQADGLFREDNEQEPEPAPEPSLAQHPVFIYDLDYYNTKLAGRPPIDLPFGTRQPEIKRIPKPSGIQVAENLSTVRRSTVFSKRHN
jgi:hypothetical protein